HTHDGRQALAKVITQIPDVVVTEARLPGIDGYRLVELLRSDCETRSISIIVVSGEADTARAHAAGADVVLVKPRLPEILLDAIGQLTAQPHDPHVRTVIFRGSQTGHMAPAPGLARSPRLSASHQRYETTAPPLTPPNLLCPACDRPLAYRSTHVGGV